MEGGSRQIAYRSRAGDYSLETFAPPSKADDDGGVISRAGVAASVAEFE